MRRKRRITKVLQRELLDFAFAKAFGEVKNGAKVRFPGFGIFYLATSKARRILNPITGQMMTIPGSWRIAFRASKFWKGSI